ncbi:MAG: hypothetical protein EOO27_23340 [Comamonadaceae bacterium]|nr:MAG: hypothetical protein EOO27_23340 [Comamonadaceae bacterium]
MDAEADRRDQLAELISRVAVAEPHTPHGACVAGALQDISATHQIDLARVRSIWDDLLRACMEQAVDIANGPELIGESCANEGRALTESLQIIQELRHLAIECLRKLAVAEGRGQPFIIAGIGEVSVSMHDYMLGFSGGYFRAEVANRARRRAQQDTFVWNVLAGTGRDTDTFNRLGAYGLDGTAPYRAFRAHPETDADYDVLEDFLRLSGHGADRGGVSTVIDGDVCGFISALPNEPSPKLVGVSGPVAFAELPVAFRRATRAFQVARLAGLDGLQSLESLGLIASVMTDRDIADVISAAYLKPLMQQGDYGETILDTIRGYVECNCQIEATARKLVLHVNTLRYRLSKFEEMLGVSLRDTRTLAEVWWAVQLPDELNASAQTPGNQGMSDT